MFDNQFTFCTCTDAHAQPDIHTQYIRTPKLYHYYKLYSTPTHQLHFSPFPSTHTIPAPPLQQLVPLKPESAAPAPFQFAEKPRSHPQVPGPSIAPTTQGDASFKQHLRMRLQRKHFRQPYPSKRPPRLTETWSIVPATPEPMQTNPPRGGRKRTLALDAGEAKRCRDEVLAYCWQSPLLWPKPRSQLNH